MAVPKKRTSSARRDKRRANHKAGKADLEQLPALPQPAAAASGLPDLRHLRRARGRRARGSPIRRRPHRRPSSRGAGPRGHRRPRRLRGRAGLRRARARARGWPRPTGSACGSSGRSARSGSTASTGIEVVDDRRVRSATTRTRSPAVRGEEGGLGRARRRATSPRAARRRWSAAARPGRRWPPRPSACAGSRACSGRPSRSSCRSPANRSSSSTSAPTSRSAPSTWSSSPSSAPPSAPRCSRSRTRRVGLLTVGEEAGKGREEVVEAHRLLSQAPGIDFAGNVEGRDLPAAAADVVVTDGFTGNVSLKLLEGTAKTVAAAVGDAARSNPLAALGGLLLKPALERPAARAPPRHHRRRDPARPARDRRRRPRQLRRRGDRQRGPPRRPLRRGRRGRPHRGAAGRGRRRPRRARRRGDADAVIDKPADDPRRSPHPGPRAPRRGARSRHRARSTRGPASRRTSTPTRSTSTSW